MTKNNPVANESTFLKLKNKIGKKGNKDTDTVTARYATADLVAMSRCIDIISEACACCWDKKIPDDYLGRLDYVSKRAKSGHTSIMEHSNFIAYVEISDCYYDDLTEFLNWVKYLSKKVYHDNETHALYMLIGGTLRGFSDIYLRTDDLNNIVLKNITSCLYAYAPSGAFEDICHMGLLEKERFANVDLDSMTEEEMRRDMKIITTHYNDTEAENDMFKIVGMDDLKMMYTNLYNLNPKFAKTFTTFDLLEYASVTVLFKNMSRIITQQLTRHRNGITQESQRYVDYSKAAFNSPALIRPDKYDKDHKYTVRFGPSSNLNMTLDEIGQAICGLYEMLNNPVITGAGYNLLREDARGFLPGNAVCRKLYMTFTYKSLFKFLQLRESSGAQTEIRLYASNLGEWIRENSMFSSKEITDTYTKPKLLIEDPFKLEEDQGVVEEVVEMTEEDYMKANGLEMPNEESEARPDNEEV